MKIKNLFIFISLLVLSLFMITSCGEDNKEGENNNQGNDNPVTEEGLSKEEFVALLVNQDNNYTMAIKQNGQTAEVSTTIKFDAKYRNQELVSFKASSENSTGDLNMYYELKDGKFYAIFQNPQTGEFVGSEVEDFNINAINSLSSQVDLDYIKEFSYDKETGKYKITIEATADGAANEEIKLECSVSNGHVTHVDIINGDFKVAVDFFDFGTTVVNIPEYTIDDEGGQDEIEGEAITSDELAQIVGNTYNNYSVEINVSGVATSYLYFDLTEGYKSLTKIPSATGDIKQYVVEIDDKYYQIDVLVGSTPIVDELADFDELNVLDNLCQQLMALPLPEFDEATGEYHFKADDSEDSTIDVKFADGKIVYVCFEGSSLRFFDYDSTTILVPDFNLPEANLSFKEILSKVEENYTATLSTSQDGVSLRTLFEYDGTAEDGDIVYAEMKMTVLDEVKYGMVYENTEYLISLVDGDWVAEESDTFSEFTQLYQNFSDLADSFVYSEQTGMYHLTLNGVKIAVEVSTEHITYFSIEYSENQSIAVSFSNFGTTEVILPEYSFAEE